MHHKIGTQPEQLRLRLLDLMTRLHKPERKAYIDDQGRLRRLSGSLHWTNQARKVRGILRLQRYLARDRA